MTQADLKPGPAGPITISHIFGEITWLLSQSASHQRLAIGDLNWLVMPAIMKKTFHLFRDHDKPVGLVLWGELDERGERKVLSGLCSNNRLEERDWRAGSQLWIIELVAPFATPENGQAEVMFADIVTGIFKNRAFKMLKIDPETGRSETAAIDEGFGERLVASTRESLRERAE